MDSNCTMVCLTRRLSEAANEPLDAPTSRPADTKVRIRNRTAIGAQRTIHINLWRYGTTTLGKSGVSDLNTSEGFGVLQSKSVQSGITTCSPFFVKGEHFVWSRCVRAIDTQRALASRGINRKDKASEYWEEKLHR